MALAAAGALLLVPPLQAQRGRLFRVPSGAMEPTLLRGDLLRPDTGVRAAQLQRGTIIVFESPVDSGILMVQRVVGLPGDTLEMRGGTLIRNGTAQREKYVRAIEPKLLDRDLLATMRKAQLAAYIGPDTAAYAPTANDWGPLRVPRGHLVLLGDNRNASYDSRFWGTLAFPLVRGVVDTVLYSYDLHLKRWRPERRMQPVH